MALLASLTTTAGAGASVLPRDGATPPPAALDAGPPAVTPVADRVLISPATMSPRVVSRTTDVRVSGTVTARSGTPLSGARIRVVTDPTRLMQRASVAAWAQSSTPARGDVVAEAKLADVAAGATTSFSVTIPAGRVRSSQVFAALPISLEVVAGAGAAPVGVTHTFLAWQSRKEYVPIRVAALVPLTLPPDVNLFSGDDAARTAAWADHLGPGSPIARVVEGTEGSQATLFVDPSIFGPETFTDSGSGAPQSPSSPSPSPASPTSEAPGSAPSSDAATPAPSATTDPATATSTVPSPTPSPTTTAPSTPATDSGPPEEAGIARLVDALVASLRDRDVWALPYADADIAAAVDIAPTNSLVRDLVGRATKVGTTLGRSARSTVFWPVDGSLSAARESRLATLVSGTVVKRVEAVVVSQAAITAPSPYTPRAIRTTAAGTRLLAYDDELSSLFPDRQANAALAVQQLLAESLVLLGERPGTERSVLLAAPRGYNPDAAGLAAFLHAMSEVEWLTPVSVDELISNPGTTAPLVQQAPRPAPEPIAAPAVLTRKRLADLAEQRDTIVQVATVLRDGAQFESRYREVLDELAGARWRDAPQAWQALNDSVVADTKSATSAITVVPQGVNFLAAEGILRITIRNGLDYAIDGIKLVVEPTNPRMTVQQPGPITVGPGALTTVRVPATARAAGRVDIRAYLTTADGTPIGQPAIMKVSANPLDSTFYWAGAILAGLVLLAGLVRTIRKGTSRVEQIGDLETVAAQVEEMEAGRHD